MSNSFAIPWTVPHQAPLSKGYSRQEYWSGLPFPPLGDRLDPGIKLVSPALAGGFFTAANGMVKYGKPIFSLPFIDFISSWLRITKEFTP